jgi:hypothetical protein
MPKVSLLTRTCPDHLPMALGPDGKSQDKSSWETQEWRGLPERTPRTGSWGEGESQLNGVVTPPLPPGAGQMCLPSRKL